MFAYLSKKVRIKMAEQIHRLECQTALISMSLVGTKKRVILPVEEIKGCSRS